MRRLRVDRRLALGLLLVALSVGGGARLLASASDTVPVLAAARDLAANQRLGSGDVRVVRVHASPDVLDGLVRADSPGAVTGRVLLVPVARDGLLARTALADAPTAGRDVTIPVTAEHALGGDVRAGERVDVLATFEKGTRTARTLTVVAGVEVVGVLRSQGLFGQRDGAVSALTLSVAPDDSVSLAFAARNGELDVVRSTGAPVAARSRVELGELP